MCLVTERRQARKAASKSHHGETAERRSWVTSLVVFGSVSDEFCAGGRWGSLRLAEKMDLWLSLKVQL
jgi:hypothetical protein